MIYMKGLFVCLLAFPHVRGFLLINIEFQLLLACHCEMAEQWSVYAILSFDSLHHQKTFH